MNIILESIHPLHFLSLLKHPPFHQWEPLQVAPMSSEHEPWSLWWPPCYLVWRKSMLFGSFPSRPGISLFSKKPSFFKWEIVAQEHIARIAHRWWGAHCFYAFSVDRRNVSWAQLNISNSDTRRRDFHSASSLFHIFPSTLRILILKVIGDDRITISH